MHKPRFQKTLIYSVLIQALAVGLIAGSVTSAAYATTLQASGDLSGQPAIDLTGSGHTKIDLATDTLGVRIYTSKAYTLKQATSDTSPIVLVRAGSNLKLNTSDIPEKTNTAVLKLTGSGSDTAAIWIGREPPPNERDIETSQPTVFQGQYLDITQKNGVAIDGNGSADAAGNSSLTTLELSNSKISGQEGIRWDDYGTNSQLTLNDVSITADNSGAYISSSRGSSTKINTDNLKITTKGTYVGTDPGTALALAGAGIDATLYDTTVSSKASAIRVSSNAVAHFTGTTKISLSDNSKAGGQNGVQAGREAVVTIDHLDMAFQSQKNSDFSGALSASNDAQITVGQVGQATRSKIELFNLRNPTRSTDVEGVNAFLGGEVTLNSLDMVNYRKKTIGEDVSDKVIGLLARYSSHITLNDSTVVLKDLKDEPFMRLGASIEHKSSLTLAQDSHVQAGQFAVRLSDKSVLTMSDSSLEAGKAAIYVMPTAGTQNDTEVQATISNSQITALQKKSSDPLGVAMRVGWDGATTDNAYLAMRAEKGSVINADYLYQVQRGGLTLLADQSTLSGAAQISPNSPDSFANMTLANGSVWHVKSDPNQPTAADYVHVNTLTLDRSEVQFERPKDMQGFQQLAVDTLEGKGGVVQLWTELQDDNSVTDQLVIREKATGTTYLRIKRYDDELDDGAQTNVGIKVVSADSGTAINTATTSATAFVLDSGSTGYRSSSTPSLVAGLYDYYLVKGGKDGEAESWYLNSKASPVDPDPDPDPDPVDPTTYRPEIDAYFANRQMAVSMQRHRWQERINSQAPGSRAWGRIVHQEDRFTNQFGYKRKMESTTLHFGTDVWQTTFSDLSKLSVGAMALFSDGKSKTRNEHLKAEGKVKGYNLGVYATWQQNPESDAGVYVDSWLMQGWFRNKVKGDGLSEEKYNSRNFSASLEGGYGFLVSETSSARYYLQPQAQVIWSRFSADDVYEDTQTRVHEQGRSFTSYRLGLRFKADVAQDNGMQLAPFAEINYWRHPSSSRMSFNERSAKDITPKNVFATTVGMQAQLSKSTSISGRFSYMMGNEKYRDSNLQLGINYAW